MKTDFSFNIAVNLGMTPELTALMGQVLSYLGNHTPNASISAPTVSEAPAEVKEEEPQPVVEEQKTEAPSLQPDKEEKKEEFTEEDVRAAMHRARMNIEGEDYKDNTDSELYKKYHKKLNAEFKRIASLLGADKPSLLTPENRQSFINACDVLTVLPDGKIGNAVPF